MFVSESFLFVLISLFTLVSLSFITAELQDIPGYFPVSKDKVSIDGDMNTVIMGTLLL